MNEGFPVKKTFYARFGKRFLDICISFFALIILSLPMLVLALLVRIKLGSPVLFTQERPGKDEKIFRLYKFRTMTNERDESGNLLPDEVRLTKFGRFLRAASLDELPEFFNVLRGDMSLIGPRPLLVSYLPLYNEKQRRRHAVRPGLSGLAQCSGRNLLTWEERFDLDVEYVENVSLTLDISIVLKTIRGVMRHEGISSETSATMEPFRGSDESILQNKEAVK
ncbi:MAG: sugar transferase [Clostridia bacterium]|nr:sugar transferase [Clostridia bacterium]